MPILSHSQTTVQGGAGRGLCPPRDAGSMLLYRLQHEKNARQSAPGTGCGKLSRHSDQNHNHEVPDHRRTTDSGKIGVIEN
jgi:hypothetical protein